MNLKLRRKEAVSAYEMHTARKLDTGHNLNLDDNKLRQSQMSARRHNTASPAIYPSPKPGDTITNLSPQPKHTARDMYIVTASTPETVTAQKILHPLSDGTTKIMSKQYTTHPKHIRILHSPPAVPLPKTQEPAPPPRAPPSTKQWSPIPQAFWESDSDDEDFDYQPPDPILVHLPDHPEDNPPEDSPPEDDPPDDDQQDDYSSVRSDINDSSSEHSEEALTLPVFSPRS